MTDMIFKAYRSFRHKVVTFSGVPQVENANPNTAIYANVTELKRNTARPPPVLPLGAALLISPEGWQVHTDKDSGKEFFYHPTTGQTTWAKPGSPLLSTSMELPKEVPAVPAPSQTPSPAHSSTSSQGSNWEKLMDDTSGQPYFYNPYSGATSWLAPEPNSPCSPVSMPLVLKRPDEGPVGPPLPEEDYPTEDHETPDPISSAFPRDIQPSQLGKSTTIPRASLDSSTLAGWNCSLDTDGNTVFTNESTQEQWLKSEDQKGKTYYYLRDGTKSQWNLPAELERSNTVTLPVAPILPKVGNGVDQDGPPVLKNWRHTMGPAQFGLSQDDNTFFPKHRRNISDVSSEASSSGNSAETPHHSDRLGLQRRLSNLSTHSHHQHAHLLEKAGILNKTKLVDNGKKIRKNWSQSWTVLHDGILTFHKDPKSAASGNSNKTSQIIPEYTVELRGATVSWAPKDKSSKKNVLELKTRHGCEYLIQYDTENIICDWHKIILDSIRQQDQDHRSEEEEEEPTEKAPLAIDKDKKTSSTRSQSGISAESSDPGRVRTKLRKFLQRRPTLQSVKEKGYIRDNVFGCHLDTLCHRENRTVPKFVEKCIRAVERRGLDIDGIYRVSGNLAVIQRLRHKADHEENLDLEDGQWEEIHVITGALKLFLRELPEPLFPYSFFDKFIAAIQIQDSSQKVLYFRDLVRSLPLPNHDTMHLLFKHLLKVIEFGDKNRMSVQSMAIVFGPTLLRPQTESANITVYMVFQNQIVEQILNEFETVFAPS
ncbi:rho GTPase-activating protein 27 isoform X5 [Esox lucius]|uniref:rho GTPase-activating protein 27 isoform X5 n=1 Tax=Esox lucius TaxID=8010 RepID=UPI0014768D37|nr:rho GTPase-activating protein 27 isoform X5 [Esox lucius]